MSPPSSPRSLDVSTNLPSDAAGAAAGARDTGLDDTGFADIGFADIGFDDIGFDDIVFEDVDPRSPEARGAMEAYFAELDATFPTGFDPGDALTAELAAFEPPTGRFVVIGDRGTTVGCAALQTLEPGIGEIKRMWIAPDRRGRGLASRLLHELEARCRTIGHHTVRLDTNATLATAIALYERSGYIAIERYNENPYAHHWFEKPLD